MKAVGSIIPKKTFINPDSHPILWKLLLEIIFWYGQWKLLRFGTGIQLKKVAKLLEHLNASLNANSNSPSGLTYLPISVSFVGTKSQIKVLRYFDWVTSGYRSAKFIMWLPSWGLINKWLIAILNSYRRDSQESWLRFDPVDRLSSQIHPDLPDQVGT